MKPLAGLILTLLVIVIFSSCRKESKCIKSAGAVKKETRTLTGFTKIELYDKINLILEPSAVNEISIEAGEHILPFVIAEVNGNTLKLEDGNKCNFLRSFKNEINVTVKFTSLNEIYFSGAGSIISKDTVKTGYFHIEARSSSGDVNLKVNLDSVKVIMHTGTSNVKIAGRSLKTELYTGGNGKMNFLDLNTDVMLCNNSGTGDVYLHVNDYLFAYLGLLGNIFYTGDPGGLDVFEENEGRLIKQ